MMSDDEDPRRWAVEPSRDGEDVFLGSSEMAARMRAYPWEDTPVGPVRDWPQSLKTAIRIILNSRYAMFVWWGRDLVNFYNDAYSPMLGSKHPTALGRSARDVWADIWHDVGPRAERVLEHQEATYDQELRLIMSRYGYPEEAYFTFSYSPVPADHGDVGGLFCAVTEDTERVINARRLQLLREIATAATGARSPDDVCRGAMAALTSYQLDLPFAAIYLADADGSLRLTSWSEVEAGSPIAPREVVHEDPDGWPFQRVLAQGSLEVVDDLAERFGAWVPRGSWDRPARRGVLVPIKGTGRAGLAGVLVAGLNPYRPFDEEFRGFIDLAASQVAAGIADASAYETERRRAEALAELDAAKTAFFSNVSHEFRTPLTLMLGPAEDALRDTAEPLPAAQRERVELLHRNGLRLLRLVNTLLDFSRIEAGRQQASYEPTDLAALTRDLASGFRSAIERGGLDLVVDCPALPEPVHVDRDMWEKIVLNLLSNAFKFTFAGSITVSLHIVAGAAELRVADTGIGIPREELDRVFDRFHRVSGAEGRTQEGTGIGLSLVQELVRMHGGAIEAESELGRGSTFIVRVPIGTAHLPADRIGAARGAGSTAITSEAFVEEALRWLVADPMGEAPDVIADVAQPDAHRRPVAPAASPSAADADDAPAAARVLLADDNADMRSYVERLLATRWQVDAVADGATALAHARANPPDLVVADVMMPRLNGFELLYALRNDPATSTTPVILLSARAGEESRVEGIEAGADDYLVKPFAARELIARVATHLKLAQLRREALETQAAALTAAQDAIRARDAFFSVASHELRTPMTALVATVQLLRRHLAQRGSIDPEQVAARLGVVDTQARKMTRLIGQLLDVTRIESGKLALQPQPVDVVPLVQEVAGLLRENAGDRAISVDAPASLTAEIDMLRVEQVLTNLLDNAIKHSPRDSQIRVVITEPEDGIFEIAVEDAGPGVPPEWRPLIFERFAQVSEGHSGGMGLGLFISRQIARQHGGDLTAQFPDSGGSRFMVRLPLQAAQPAPPQEAA